MWGALAVSVGANYLLGEQSKSSSKSAAAAADPFAGQRKYYQKQLKNLMANPADIVNQPGYQFNYNQGLNALERGLSAGGHRLSGRRFMDVMAYGQDYANKFYGETVDRLANLSGAYTGSPATAGQVMSEGASEQRGYTSDIISDVILATGYGATGSSRFSMG